MMLYLSETHLVGQNTIDTLLVEGSKPVQALQLVLLQSSHQHVRLLDSQLAGQRGRVLEVELIGVHYK